MFPISDDNSDRRITPVVNYVLIGLCVLIFLVFQGMGKNEAGTLGWAAVPAEIVTAHDIVTPESVAAAKGAPTEDWLGRPLEAPSHAGDPRFSLGVYLTLITCMFLHGGWAHLGGNMLYLWIFGDNLEDALGHVRYLLFYLVTGIAATMAHIVGTLIMGQDPLVPLVGASGAISGVLGGYMLLYPFRGVQMFVLRTVITVPAWMSIGLWFAMQLISTFASAGGQGSGVAYLAHVGGFVAGLALVKVFQFGRPKAPEWALHH
jgi:membrane associated rhomboid family serine protease